jgi:hypothetical protein
MSPAVLVHANDPDTVEPAGVVDQHPRALGEDGIVGGVPGDAEPGGYPGHRQVLHDDPFQRPPQPSAGQLRPRFGGLRGVLTPHVAATGAAVAADRDQQGGGPPPERFVCQRAGHGVADNAFAAAPVAPSVRVCHSARQHRTVGLEALPGDFESELVQSAEQGQISAGEARGRDSVNHVEVFQDGQCENFHPRKTSTPIPGPTRPPSPHPHL